ncbi:nuclear transport factor 2 family protein [Hymenobacter sp. BT507]|uniref:Nuclear transport factor 2 family protein n=1 Tax=Hymenobacter citatus TaxID=2763506 RepID=A0ABR7MNU1_9BACT|nr:nuclear transport factor 2 family protein [Hymenobacter citatus]MBC6612754.1 nuclear transport factor 2 family protein [Hymenobacter citatus]
MRILFGLLLGGVLASCSSNTASDAVNVQSLNQQFIGAWNSKNTAQLDSLLADDVQFVQGETHYKGKAEVADKWVRATIGSIANLKTYTASSSADTQLAYDAGTFTAEVLPETAGGPQGEGEGNYMLLWKKDANNKWKLSYAQLEDLPVQVK